MEEDRRRCQVVRKDGKAPRAIAAGDNRRIRQGPIASGDPGQHALTPAKLGVHVRRAVKLQKIAHRRKPKRMISLRRDIGFIRRAPLLFANAELRSGRGGGTQEDHRRALAQRLQRRRLRARILAARRDNHRLPAFERTSLQWRLPHILLLRPGQPLGMEHLQHIPPKGSSLRIIAAQRRENRSWIVSIHSYCLTRSFSLSLYRS